MADAVHAVVPVAGAHQRQSVRADTQAAVDRARRMFVDRGGFAADGGRVVGVFGTFGDGGAFDERHGLSQQAGVAGGLQVASAGVWQPQQVVGEMRAHARATRRMPPVLHIAFGKLPRGVEHDLPAQQVRRGPGQRHRVLQLIAETEGAAGLVKTGLRPESARHRLVQQPAVDHRVEQRVGGLHCRRAEQRVPVLAHRVHALGRRRRCGLHGKLPRGLGARRVAQQEHPLDRFASDQTQSRGQRSARVQPAAAALAEVVGQHQAAARVEAFAPVAGPVARVVAGIVGIAAGQGQKRGAAAEAGRSLGLGGQQRGQSRCAGRFEPRCFR